ncbi:MAG: 30S ribosomal protein S20 [Actinobacteria bacterium]|nr:30S ribosomal protein S20 [Actinomycetota bacterium]
MANIKSQIKRIRQNERRRIRNKSTRSEIKTYMARFRKAADAGDKEVAASELKSAVQKLDRAAEKGIIHKNNAANKKSSLTKQFDRMA